MPEKAKLNYKRAPVSATAQDANAGPRGKSAGTQSDRMMKKVSVPSFLCCRLCSDTPVDGSQLSRWKCPRGRDRR